MLKIQLTKCETERVPFLQGFATFAEDRIHSRAISLIKERNPKLTSFMGYPLDVPTPQFYDDLSALRALIRYKTLKSEVSSTEDDLQKMRPMKGQELRSNPKEGERDGDLYVKNGLNPEIVYTQVHYIKGYFLLR